MAKIGRGNAYETRIKPRFDDITKWLQSGATEKQIASNLNVAYSTFNKYKAEVQEFSELLKNGREKLVVELRGALVNRAMGFHYYEETEVKELDKENWSNDPRSDDFKREELEMKKKALEENNW